MCVTSFIGDQFGDRWRDRFYPTTYPATTTTTIISGITREEFDALKSEVELLKGLLVAAQKYDEEHGEPDCEMEEKVELLKRVAELVGVDLSEVLG